MGLNYKQRKYINNTRQLPKLKDGFGEKIGQSIPGLIGMLGSFLDTANPKVTSGEMIRSGGTQYIDGNGYNTYVTDTTGAEAAVKAQKFSGILSGAATGAGTGMLLGGPVGAGIGTAVGAIGGLISGNSAEEELESLKHKAIVESGARNQYGFDSAFTESLRQKQAKKIGNPEDQILHAKNGLEPVLTSHGFKIGDQNAWGEKGEWIWDTRIKFPKLGHGLEYIPYGKNDTAAIRVGNYDAIFTDNIKNSKTGKTFAKSVPEAAANGALDELLMDQAMTKYGNKYKKGMLAAKCGKLPKYSIGAEIVPSIIGGITGLGQLLFSNQDTSRPRSYVYANTGRYVDDLYNIQANSLPIINANREATARANAAVRQSGVYGSAQGNLAYLANAMAERQQNAQTNLAIQNQNAQSKTVAAQAGINAELQNAQRTQQANQWDYDKEAASHNAMVEAWQNGLGNIKTAAAEYIKNNWDRNRYEDIIDLYRQDAKRALAELNARTGKDRTWSLKDDVNSNKTFETYAPSPFKQIKDVWATKPKYSWDPKPNVDVPFVLTEQAMLKQLKKKSLNRKRK